MLLRTPERTGKHARANLAFFLILVALALVGGGASYYVYSQIDHAGRVHILERVATIAVAVPEDTVLALSGSESDLGTPAYEELKSFLERMRSVNHDARFLYLVGKLPDGELFFYADSESAESPDYSPPGQIYYEASPGMQAIFEDAVRSTEGPDQDRWGVWISGYAPVLDTAGNVIAVMGMDLPAQRFIADAAAYAMLPLLVTLLLILILLAAERTRRNQLAYVEQKAEFLSIASHEIRTPLTGIRWAVEGLLKREDPPLNPKTRAVLALVHESCLGLIGRVNNLLDLTKLEEKGPATMRIETIEIASFLEDIVDSLQLSAQQRGVTLVLDDSVARAGTFEADQQMMHHAFFNLLTNALKYTREGTEVRVRYERTEGSHSFRVLDRGEGIPHGEQERIFGGYYRTKEAVKGGQFGSGLGLYLSKRAAELHGGTIRVSSAEGEGSTFILTIPETPTTSGSSR